MQYQQVAQSWHDYFLIAGAAAATLVGLLFVGLSLHLRAVLALPEVRALARATLANFGLVLFVSLFAVVPEDARSVSVQMEAFGAFSLVVITPALIAAARSRSHTLRGSLLILRFAISIGGYIATIGAGVLFANGEYNTAFASLLASSIALLLTSLRNTWDLLVSVGDATLAGESDGSGERSDASVPPRQR
ncbi:MAG: hypothetical protein JOY80_00810 [Candidatus Dormibacteraeota bacterium]|nr:hypothetical protein [Candidatus Dormibacteraeota bacterium]